MTRNVCTLLFAATLIAAGSASRASAQAPAAPPYYPEWMTFQIQRGDQGPTPVPMGTPAPAPPGSQAAPTPNFETGWPRPPEIAPSLFREAATPTPYGCYPISERYFELDPLVDPPQFPPPGFVADFELQAVVPHIFQSLSNGVQIGPNAPGTIHEPITPFNWTASPRIELGWRLPEGFGAFMINYQFISASGTGTTPYGPTGAASLRGHLDYNLSDFDYVSREFTPWEHWGMIWRFGFRQMYLYYDTQSTPLVPGTGVVQQFGSNYFRGWGGHIGLEMDREFNRQVPGLSLVAKADFSDVAGFVQQGVSQTTTTGGYTFGGIQNGQGAPSLMAQLGLSYRPPGNRWEFYVGGFYQYWWNVGTLPNFALNSSGSPMSGGELSLTGVTFRISWNY